MPARTESAAPETAAAELARLRWKCRRGMRELDVLLGRFLEGEYPRAGEAVRRAFAALLELQDPEIHAYLLRRRTPAQPELADVVARICGPLHGDTAPR